MMKSKDQVFHHPSEWVGDLLCLNLAQGIESKFILSLPKLIYCTVLLLLFITNYSYTVIWLTVIQLDKSNINTLTYVCFTVLHSLPPVASLYISLIRRNRNIQTLNRINAVLNLVEKKGFQHNPKRKLSNYLIVLNIVFIVLTICGDVYISTHLDTSNNYKQFPSLYIRVLSALTMYVSKLFYVLSELYFIIFFLTLNEVLNYSRHIMKDMLTKKPNISRRKVTVKNLNTIFNGVLNIKKEMNIEMSVQFLVVCVSYIFTAAPVAKLILTDLHNNITGNEINIYRPIHGTCYSVYGLVLIIGVVHVCESSAKEVKNMAAVIHDLVSTGEADDVANELFDFSLSLLHLDFHFTACDFFPIDYTLIRMVIGSTTSYLVYLIQFQVSSSSHLPPANTSLHLDSVTNN